MTGALTKNDVALIRRIDPPRRGMRLLRAFPVPDGMYKEQAIRHCKINAAILSFEKVEEFTNPEEAAAKIEAAGVSK